MNAGAAPAAGASISPLFVQLPAAIPPSLACGAPGIVVSCIIMTSIRIAIAARDAARADRRPG